MICFIQSKIFTVVYKVRRPVYPRHLWPDLLLLVTLLCCSVTLISLCCSSDTLPLKTFTLFLLFDLLFPKISTFGIFHFNKDPAWVPLLWLYCAGSSAPIAVSFSPAFLTLYVIRLSSCLLLDLDCKFQKSFFHYCIP